MLICVLAINLVLTVIYAVIRLVHHESMGMAVFFLFLPGLGFVIYFLPGLLRLFLENAGVDREAVLTHAFQIERQPEHPDVHEALNVVPVEDAMAISGNMEKRTLLLAQLKKSLTDNYRILLAAEQDEDSESAHYVAAAKMEIYRLQQTQWLECRRDYEADPGDPEKCHAACTALMKMIDSGVLSEREQNAYRNRLCALVQEEIDSGNIEVSLNEYEGYLNSLVELGLYADAEKLWQNHSDQMRSETVYHDMLKMFYKTGERQKFERMLDDLRKNKQIRLSPNGLEHLRYWTNRLAGATAQS